MENTPLILNIDRATVENRNYRQVLYTGTLQLVLMSIAPGDEIGEEVHHEVDQFIRVEKGLARVVLNGQAFNLKADEAVVIPRGTVHNVINRSRANELKLYTIYAPPNHPPATLERLNPGPDHHH